MPTSYSLSHLLLISILLCSACTIGSASPLPSRETLGIAPQDEGYYVPKVIKCRDGSKTFTKEQLNDDFCDCPDGTDEPGTSACPEGKFYCRNSGHAPVTIFSSRVNDGICDCCDGSDEYDGRANCSNTCWEAGKIAREKLKKKIETYQGGVIIRRQEVEKAKVAFARDEAEVSKLRKEESILKNLVQKLREKKEQIEKAEEEERLQREKEEKKLRESETNVTEQGEHSQSEETTNYDAKESNVGGHGFSDEEMVEEIDDSPVENENDLNIEQKSIADPDVNQNVEEEIADAKGKDDMTKDVESVDLLSDHMAKNLVVGENDGSMLKSETAKPEEPASGDAVEEEQGSIAEGLSKEELGRLVASRWTGENTAHKHDDMDSPKKDEGHKDEFPDSAEGEYYDGYNSETDEDSHKYGDDDDEFQDSNNHHEHGDDNLQREGDYDPESEDITESSDFTASNGKSWLDKIQQTVQHILQAFNFFKPPVNTSEAAFVRKEYDDASSKLSKMQSRISSLTEKLKHDFGMEKEFYSFYDSCFEIKENKYTYKVCPFKQASQVEGHSTTRLGQWEKFDDNYRLMQFLNGDRCWNGPDRSLKVRLRCGLKNELADVDEPSRCEYSAILSTPLLCLEERLKELQGKLHLMNSGQPSPHDEL